jgi:hypothetical protein
VRSGNRTGEKIAPRTFEGRARQLLRSVRFAMRASSSEIWRSARRPQARRPKRSGGEQPTDPRTRDAGVLAEPDQRDAPCARLPISRATGPHGLLPMAAGGMRSVRGSATPLLCVVPGSSDVRLGAGACSREANMRDVVLLGLA